MLSLLVWLFAQLPQIIENHINQSVEGVSFMFLLCWIAGDTTNLIGCILTRALPFQTCLATYYCFIDLILSFQFWYYTRVYPRQRVHHNLLQSPDMLRPTGSRPHAGRTNRFESPRNIQPLDFKRKRSFITALSASVVSTFIKPANAAPAIAQTLGATVLDGLITRDHIGMASAWTCSALYILSRVPQIIKNYKTRSTKGVLPFLFLFAMLGNLFYTVSIGADLYMLWGQHDAAFHDILMAQLPFLLGSSGTVVFDITILIQHRMWRHPAPETGFNHDLHMNKSPDWFDEDFYASHHAYASAQSRPKDPFNTPDERTSLLNYGITPPPPNYISASLQKPTPKRFSVFNTVSPKQRSLSQSLGMMIPHSGSMGPAHSLDTSLIPSIVGNYSSISKKMLNETKVPFSPIDFLGTSTGSRSDWMEDSPRR